MTTQTSIEWTERMAIFFRDYEPPRNAWLSVTVENRQHGIPRLDWLRQVPAHIRFASVEPLLEDLGDVDLHDIHWVIVGGESGPGARPMEIAWVRDIRDQCLRAGTAFFFKQWGGTNRKKTGRLLDGRTWDDNSLTFTTDPTQVRRRTTTSFLDSPADGRQMFSLDVQDLNVVEDVTVNAAAPWVASKAS